MKQVTAVLAVAALNATLAHSASAQPRPGVATARDDLLPFVRVIAARITNMLFVARRGHDRARTTCLDDKLTQAHAALADARVARLPRLRNAIRMRAHEIALAAEACGQPRGEMMGGPSRETSIDPSIPSEDPTLLEPQPFVVQRPPSASGYY